MTPTLAHTEDHEDLLQRVVTGELDRHEPSVRAQVAGCPECRKRLEELTTLVQLMEHEGQEEMEILESLDYGRNAPGSDLVAPFFKARVAELPDVSVRRRPWRFVAAAAVIVTSLGIWFIGDQRSVVAEGARTLLGTSAFQFRGATGEVEDFGLVIWEAAGLSSASRYEITVYDNGPGAAADPVLEPFTVKQAAWIPSDEQRQQLPPMIRVVVVALDVTGQVMGSPGDFVASRSR